MYFCGIRILNRGVLRLNQVFLKCWFLSIYVVFDCFDADLCRVSFLSRVYW
jgi:hypothetical protein